MRNLIWLAVLVGIVIAAKMGVGRFLDEKTRERAEHRVAETLANAAAGSTAAEQEAISWWASGQRAIPPEELRAQVEPFEAWRREKNLGTIREHRVDEVALEAPGSDVAIAEVTVDGRKLRIRVTPGQRLAWVD